MNDGRNQNSLRSKVSTLAPMFQTSIGTQAAASATTIPRSTVARIYRAMRLINEGRTDQEIADSVHAFSVRSIAEIRSAYSDAIGGTKGNPSIERFIADHRRRLYGLAERLTKQVSKERVDPWPTQWIGQSWPGPFTGPCDGAPLFGVESEPGFGFMAQHLESLRLETTLAALKVKARALRERSLQIMSEVPSEMATALSEDILRATVLYGSQMAEAPNQEYPEIDIAPRRDLFALNVNAYSSEYETRSDAEQAAIKAREVIEFVRRFPATHEFYGAREELMNALETVRHSLAIREAVNLQIDQAICQQCGPLNELSDNA